MIGARTRATTLTRLVLTMIAMMAFGLPNIFSSVGLSAWVLLVASSAYRPVDVLMNLWIVLQTGSSAVTLMGFMIRKKLSIVLGASHLIALMNVQFLFWTVERHQKAIHVLLELLAASVLVGAFSNVTQSLPVEVLVFCLVMGWKTSRALGTVALLICSTSALYKCVMKSREPKNGYRGCGMSMWFWIVSLASAGAIWTAEKANHPTVAAVLALSLIVVFLYMDQMHTTMSLEFLSRGETPEGVALENDEGRALPELHGNYGDEGIVVGSVANPTHIPEMVVILLVGCALTSVSVFLGALYMVIALGTNIPHNILRLLRRRIDEQFRSDDLLGIGGPNAPELENSFGELPNGVYRIIVNSMLENRQRGIGVAKNGVFHTLMHVTRGEPLSWRGKNVIPHSGSALRDVISYGGSWQLDAPTVTDDLVLMHS